MADLMSHSLSFSKESISEYFIKPLFVQSDIRDIVTVRLDIKNSEKLDFIDNLEKITKAYAQGTSFTSSTGVTITQKTLTVVDMKAQVEQNGKAFLNYVKESLLKKGVDENDIGGTLFEEILMEIYMAGIARDFQRQIFFGDTVKETRSSGVPTGTLDADYKEYVGFWTRIINDFDSAALPAGQYEDLNSSTYQTTVAVKEVDTVTLTGTSGTCNVNINGVDYLATFDTDLTTTAANFVTSHAATILAREGKLVVTSSGADIIVTAGIAGMAQQDPTVSAAITGDLTGSNANTTANVANTTLKTDAALTAFKAMWSKMPNTLRKLFKMEGRIMVTSSVADNYTDTIETLNGSDAAYFTLRDGERVKAFRGVPIVEREEWDEHIEADFGSVRPHRILFTIPRNLVVGTDGISDDTKIESWYEKKDQLRYVRVEYKAGTQYVHEDYIVAAY
jgi:hypothetical protein